MGLLFDNELFDGFGCWPLAYIPYGGADAGEVVAVAKAVGAGGAAAYYQAWMDAGDRQARQAEAALARGAWHSARALFLKASCSYATSYHPLYGAPVDPRVAAAFQKLVACLDRGLALGPEPTLPMRIPFEATTLPGYLIPAVGAADQRRPLLILTNGYDGTITDMYFASAVAASRRGYHCLLFDGPGQGELLIEQGIPLRPDWETVVTAVVDAAMAMPLVDRSRIALSGWSLGGYLAPRAASGEPRLAACIADPGQWSMPGSFRSVALKLGASPETAANLGRLEPQVLERLWKVIEQDSRLHWSIVQRGFWVHGVDTLRDYLASAEQYTLQGRVGGIRCPTLFTQAENDPLAARTAAFFERLTCPKTLLTFSAVEGAGDHCEMQNRSLLNDRVLDWLDEVMAVRVH